MPSQFAHTPDGFQIAYDVTGRGPAIMLLHGGWRTRQDWHEFGYVDRLRDQFTVISMDFRGHGESSKPTTSAAYTIDAMCADMVAVAEACSVDQFAIWGFSYGGNVGRFLAARSERVRKMIIMGIPFGPAISGGFRDWILNYCAKWQPVIDDFAQGKELPPELSAEDQEQLKQGEISVRIAWLQAMLEWGSIKPADMLCPTLWLVGSENELAMQSVEKYKQQVESSPVQIHIAQGLDHSGELEDIEQVLSVMLEFT